jgi:hypothetical protein
MTSLVITANSPDGTRTFELMVHFEERLVMAESCIELCGTSREWRDTRSMLLLVGRTPGSPA